MNDLEKPLTDLLTGLPSTEQTDRDGADHGSEPAVSSASDAPASDSPLTGFCSSCGKTTRCSEKGSCSVCGKFVRSNRAAPRRKDGLFSDEQKQHVDQLRLEKRARLIDERGGDDAIDEALRSQIDVFASVAAQIEVLTRDQKSLAHFDKWKGIVETFERARKELPPPVRGMDTSGVPSMPIAVNEVFLELLDAAELTPREQRMLDALVTAAQKANGWTALVSAAATVATPAARAARTVEASAPVATVETVATTQLPPRTAANHSERRGNDEQIAGERADTTHECQFCDRSLVKCEELRETRLGEWRALHYNDSSERERRDAEANAVMAAALGVNDTRINP